MKQNSTKSYQVYRRLLRHYITPFIGVVLLGILANMLYSGIDAGFTYLLKPFMNKGFVTPDLAFIQWIPLIILLGIIVRGSMSATGGYCMTWVARQVVKRFREQVFFHMIHLPASYYDRSSSGQLLSKLLYNVEQIAQVSADALTSIVQSTCLIIGLLSVMFIINWRPIFIFFADRSFCGCDYAIHESAYSSCESCSSRIDGRCD